MFFGGDKNQIIPIPAKLDAPLKMTNTHTHTHNASDNEFYNNKQADEAHPQATTIDY